MADLLDFFANSHTPYLHARGKVGTAALIRLLEPQPGQRLLEYGFGTGQTLIELQVRHPEIEIFGLEKSPQMLAVARKRLRFCGLNGDQLQLYEKSLPFPDNYFDTVYGESVLAILPDDQLPGMFAELFRVLQPGGRLVCNESLWRPGVPAETIRTINRQCLEWFGIIQASAQYPTLNDWKTLGEQAGFRLALHESLEHIQPVDNRSWSTVGWRSALFSRLGWIKSRLSPQQARQKRVWKERENVFAPYGQFLEGQLLVFQK